MGGFMSSDIHALVEADRETRREGCAQNGHDFNILHRRLVDPGPAGIRCARCGWSGDIVMGERPSATRNVTVGTRARATS